MTPAGAPGVRHKGGLGGVTFGARQADGLGSRGQSVETSISGSCWCGRPEAQRTSRQRARTIVARAPPSILCNPEPSMPASNRTSKRRRTQQTQTPRGHTDHSLPVRPPLPLKRRTTTPHTGRGATAGAEETAASHSRDSNSAGIAGADANEDAEAIAGSTNTDHGSRVSSLSGYAGQTGKYRESQDRYADRNQEQTPKRSRARNKTAHSSRDTSSME